MARLRIETVPEITVKDEAFVVKAASGATAPLIQFKNSAGTVVGSLNVTGELSIDSLVVSNAGSGSGSLATRGYVDSLAAGLNWHDSVAYATAAALPASTYFNGTLGVGATLTGNANGRLTVDGSSQTTGESILVKNQASATQNGIYSITAQGDSSNPFILTRRTDSNNSIVGQVSAGDSVYVVSGSTNNGQGFTLTSVGTGTAGVIVFGTDSLTFTQFTGTSAFVSGAGLATTGNTVNIGTASSSRIIINEDNIDLATVEQTNTSGSSTTSFINAITVDSYGRITGKQSSSVSFAGYALLASPTFTGTVTIPSGASIAGFAPLASPALTGTPTSTTASAGTNTTQIATTAFVTTAVSGAAVTALNDIGDVTITTPAAGQTIQWNGSAWINVIPTGTTVTTTANRSTDIPSPFIGQLIVLTDTKKVQLWDGTAWLNITMAPPEPPTSLSAIESTTSVAISFTAGVANGSAITNYKYALSTDGGSTYGSFTALSPADFTTPVTVSGLSMNTAYYVKLKAVNDIGDSVASSAVSFTTEGVPATPTSLSASNVTGSSVDIAFTAGAANGASISNYKYAVSTDDVTYSAFAALSPADFTTPVTVSGLTSGTLQYIKLKAVNSNGDSAASAAVSFTTTSTPNAPTSLSAGSVTSTTVDISFTAGDQGGSAISNYQYALSTDSGSTYGSFTALNPTDAATPITITGLTAGTAYYAKLKAVNTAGAGTESSAVSFTTAISVEYLVIAGGSSGTDANGGGGGGAGGYLSSVIGELSGRNSAAKPVLGLAPGVQYTVTVGASNNPSTLASITTTGRSGNGGSSSDNYSAGGGGAGTAGEGFDGGTGTSGENQSNTVGGGGGGAGASGSGQNGGSGIASSITGTSTYRAGGGGGGKDNRSGTSPGAGGAGGGGGQGVPGTANTGGGGGGGGFNGSFASGAQPGGSGIVILRYANTYANLTAIGAGLTYTVTNTGGYRIYSFTAGTGLITI